MLLNARASRLGDGTKSQVRKSVATAVLLAKTHANRALSFRNTVLSLRFRQAECFRNSFCSHTSLCHDRDRFFLAATLVHDDVRVHFQRGLLYCGKLFGTHGLKSICDHHTHGDLANVAPALRAEVDGF